MKTKPQIHHPTRIGPTILLQGARAVVQRNEEVRVHISCKHSNGPILLLSVGATHGRSSGKLRGFFLDLLAQARCRRLLKGSGRGSASPNAPTWRMRRASSAMKPEARFANGASSACLCRRTGRQEHHRNCAMRRPPFPDDPLFREQLARASLPCSSRDAPAASGRSMGKWARTGANKPASSFLEGTLFHRRLFFWMRGELAGRWWQRIQRATSLLPPLDLCLRIYGHARRRTTGRTTLQPWRGFHFGPLSLFTSTVRAWWGKSGYTARKLRGPAASERTSGAGYLATHEDVAAVNANGHGTKTDVHEGSDSVAELDNNLVDQFAKQERFSHAVAGLKPEAHARKVREPRQEQRASVSDGEGRGSLDDCIDLGPLYMVLSFVPSCCVNS